MTEIPFALISADYGALLDAAPASAEKLQIKRVFQGTGSRVIRLTLAEKQIMREHSTNSPLLVQVLEGLVAFRVAGDELLLPSGAMLHVEPSEPHEVEAMRESHLLLILTL